MRPDTSSVMSAKAFSSREDEGEGEGQNSPVPMVAMKVERTGACAKGVPVPPRSNATTALRAA